MCKIRVALKECERWLRPCLGMGVPQISSARLFTPYTLKQWSGGIWERGILARRASFDSLLP